MSKSGERRKEASRHIPKNVSEALQQRHFFECAWCGTQLTERHHIEPYALGGRHTEQNLILLCPNCHTQLHHGRITAAELKGRKSTHLRGDRVEGNFTFGLNVPHFRVGGITVIDTPVLIAFKGEPVFSWTTSNSNLILLSMRLHNKEGELVFWMANNRYWAPDSFRVESQKNTLTISCTTTPFFHMRFFMKDQKLHIEGLSFMGGQPLFLTDKYLISGMVSFSGGFTMEKFRVAISFG